MDKYIRVVNGVIEQVQDYQQEGFIKCNGNPIASQLYISDGNYQDPPPIPKTEEQIASEKKLAGVEFNGVMCSATGEDNGGFLAVKNCVEDFGMSTNFKFKNGNELLVTPENFAAFAAVWIPFRASFF